MAVDQMFAWAVVSGEPRRLHCVSLDAAAANDVVEVLQESGLSDVASVQVMLVESAYEFLGDVAQDVDRL